MTNRDLESRLDDLMAQMDEWISGDQSPVGIPTGSLEAWAKEARAITAADEAKKVLPPDRREWLEAKVIPLVDEILEKRRS